MHAADLNQQKSVKHSLMQFVSSANMSRNLSMQSLTLTTLCFSGVLFLSAL